MSRKPQAAKPEKVALREQLDRELGMVDQQSGVTLDGRRYAPSLLADKGQGPYSVDPTLTPSDTNPPNNKGSVEPGAPVQSGKVPVIPTASYDPIRSEGNWAPFRPVPLPIPGIVPGFQPAQPMMGQAQWGGTGTPVTSGFLQDLGEYNPEVYGRNAVLVYEKMRRGDAQVWATLAAQKSPLRSARWDIRPGVGPNEPGYKKAKEVSDFVKENIFGGLEFQTSTGGMTTQSWDEVLWNALLCLDFGCSIHENVFRVDGNYLKLRAMVPLLPITFYRWHTEADGHTLISLEQYGYRGIEFLNATIPAEKICRFTMHQEGANFWGISMLRPAYPSWFIKEQLYRVDAIAGERNGLGVPVVTLPEGASAQDQAFAYNFVTKLSAHELTGLVLPAGGLFKIEGVSGQPRDIMKSIEHHNRQISTAAMAMFMTIGSAPHGSRSTAATQHDFFLSSTHFLSNYIGERLSQTTIKKLVRYNFGEDAVVPKIRAMNLKMRDFEDVRGSLETLAAQGLVVSDLPLRNYIREEYELPKESQEGVLIQKKGEGIVNDPGGKDIATPTDVPDTGQPGGVKPSAGPKNQGGQAIPKPDKGAPAQIGNKSPAQQPNQTQYGKQIKTSPGVTQARKAGGNVVESSEVRLLLGLDGGAGGRMDQVVQAPDEELSDAAVDADFEPTIYFVRHGETADDVNPADGIVSSWSDVPLTAKGLKEAEATAKLLAKVDIAEIYAGDLTRTMQTAEAISEATGVPITEERGLRGWNVGAYTGLRADTELKNGRTIAQQLQWLQAHPNIKPRNGDSWQETDARINDAIAACIRRAEQLDKPIVVVTHSRVINSLPSLSRGAIPQAESEEKGAMLGRVAKAVKGEDGWSIIYNTKKLSDAGYQSIADDMPVVIPNNQSGSPTYRPESKAPNPPPASDEQQEATPSHIVTSPAIGGTAPQRSGKSKKVPAKNVAAQQAAQGATIIHGGTSFKPSASQERKIAAVPEELQPSDKQDDPLEPTPDEDSVVAPETFADITVKAPVKTKTGKVTHYETVHGAEAVRAIRAQHRAAFQSLLAHLTGPVKAKIIGSIARQAAKQLKAKVSPGQLHFVLEPHLEAMVTEQIGKIHEQAKNQVKAEVKKKK
jgi:broad specificity phosphatase PhoE